MPCSIKFSMTLQAKNISAETETFFEQIIILKSLNSLLYLRDMLIKIQISGSVVDWHVSNKHTCTVKEQK